MTEKNNLKNILRNIICVALRLNGASQRDILVLLSTQKELKETREYYMQYNCIFKVDYETFNKNYHKIQKLHLIGTVPDTEINFYNLKYFKSLDFNQPVSDFKKLLVFECFNFNQPVSSFGNLKNFECARFNQPVTSFGNLLHFDSTYFNQPITSFGNLIYFKSFSFNQPVNGFDKLIYFNCFRFNQPVASFDNLRHFFCFSFRQPVMSLGNVKNPIYSNYVFVTNLQDFLQNG